MKSLFFQASELALIAGAQTFQHASEPELRVGDVVQLNSGSPRMMVVDVEHETITVAWRDENGFPIEVILPSSCVHRSSLV